MYDMYHCDKRTIARDNGSTISNPGWISQSLPEKASCVTISKVRKYTDLYGATKEGYEHFRAVILDDVSHKRERKDGIVKVI